MGKLKTEENLYRKLEEHLYKSLPCPSGNGALLPYEDHIKNKSMET
jgi:hypothetical protein